MSRAAYRAATKHKRPEVAEMLNSVRLAAMAGGCTCSADVRLVPRGGSVFIASVEHDAWCKHRKCPAGCRCWLCKMAAGPAPTQTGGAA